MINKLLFSFFLLVSCLTVAQEDLLIDKKYSKAVLRLVKNKKIKAAFETIEKIDSKTLERHLKLTRLCKGYI